MPGSYDQYCPIARGLDVVGDRWTLLVLRELSLGEQRFTDLRRYLPGIPPNVLSQRLKRLAEHDLVTTAELPPPAARTIYKLTDRGQDILPVLRALARFGMPELEPATADRTLPPDRIAGVVFMPWFDDAASLLYDVDEHYDLHIDGHTSHLVSRFPGARRWAEGPAALELDGPPSAFVNLRHGGSLNDGDITVDGPKAAQDRFRRIFHVD